MAEEPAPTALLERLCTDQGDRAAEAQVPRPVTTPMPPRPNSPSTS